MAGIILRDEFGVAYAIKGSDYETESITAYSEAPPAHDLTEAEYIGGLAAWHDSPAGQESAEAYRALDIVQDPAPKFASPGGPGGEVLVDPLPAWWPDYLPEELWGGELLGTIRPFEPEFSLDPKTGERVGAPGGLFGGLNLGAIIGIAGLALAAALVFGKK